MSEKGLSQYMEANDPGLEDSSLDIASLLTAGAAGLGAAAVPVVRNKLAIGKAKKRTGFTYSRAYG